MPEVITHEGVTLELGPHVSGEIAQYIRDGSYERKELGALRRCLRGDDVIMELGAGIGFISIQCARIVGEERVFSYEANPSLEPHIRRNFDLNAVHPMLRIGVLANRSGVADFYVDPDFWGSSTIATNASAACVSVPIIPLNEEIRRVNPSAMIVDIEGGEYELLEAIDYRNIRLLSVELHRKVLGDEKIAAIQRWVAAAGFEIDPELSHKRKHLVARRFISRSGPPVS